MIHLSIPLAIPPWTRLGRKLESLCRKALYEYQLVKEIDKLAIALSGGKDSLSLLFLLKAILGRGFPPIQLHAIHIGGDFSCGAGMSRSFLKGICEQLEVPLTIVNVDQDLNTLQCYSCSRNRRKILFETAKSVQATTIAFGHHRDDSIETLFMNLMHKAEFAAMLPKVPMYDYGVTVIRPLIYVPEENLMQFAKLYEFSRVVCQCPVGQKSMRKTVKNILKDVQEKFPNATDNLAIASRMYGSQKALKKP
ncbi:MAG: tRNA 2-thiocytidine biosynthesis TtcA family protein [Chlamydiales bacterium]|jgi:tRNA(Ile)-lysidine synthase TilS/MesJ|nr:tRNA 2-thiocytidine biosynthesis TtcA family protein [Chlamydiales bacterium]